MQNPPEPCREPFTPCWCETRPNNPNCKPSLPIDSASNYFIIVAVLLAFISIFKPRITGIKEYIKNKLPPFMKLKTGS